MKNLKFLLGCLLFALGFSGSPCFAQCNAPEVVKGAIRYNALVCQGVAESQKGDQEKALRSFLEASKEPVLESPNILVFGRIAETYAHLGQFREADLYLKYDDLSLLWLIGVVRCQEQSNTDNETLLKDGERLNSLEAKHMAGVLCGPIFDNDSYFADRDAESFVPVAKAILRYSALRKEVYQMRAKQPSSRQ